MSLLRDTWDSLDGVEEVLALRGVRDVRVDEKGVRLGVDVLHHNLESIEAPGLGCLDLVAEALDEILVHDAIGSGEEGEDVGDEVPLVVVEAVVPVTEILGEVDFLGSPEGGFGFLVELPDLG